jgi:hypothetical protein
MGAAGLGLVLDARVDDEGEDVACPARQGD